MIKIGTSDTTIYAGDDVVKYIYVGTTQVYSNDSPTPPTPTPSGYSSQYLTFEIISGGTISWNSSNVGVRFTLNYGYDGNFVEFMYLDTTTDSQFHSIEVNAGDIVNFKGNYAPVASTKYAYFSTDAVFKVYGNIMSIYDDTNFETDTELYNNYQFANLFKNCTGLTDASNLILPATTLTNYCYQYMFSGCTSLTTAPELPATTLTNGCYRSMFYGCSNLTVAPELPATTLVNSCYSSMFKNCTSLTTAPELPATTLANSCYKHMFNGCTNLNYIKCLATNISATECLNNWVYNVAASGTFVKDAGATWETGVNGIPEGWTVEDAS